MKIKALAILIATFLLSSLASAQTPPDVQLFQNAGVYNFNLLTGPDTDLAESCCIRDDAVPIIELGCQPATEPDTIYPVTITVTRTTFDDAEIRCYLVDTSSNISALSDNKGNIDFTPPAKGLLEK